MDGWKDQSDYSYPETSRRRSNGYRKPPLGGSSYWQQGGPNWQQTVPSWEKKFCSSVGSISWKKLLETKKTIHLYDNIIKWNDSAGKEAFEKAKHNFYANMYNLPSDTGTPDADIYIDDVNWDSEVDQNLLLDLDSDSVVPDSKNEQVVIFGSSFPPNYQNFSPYGWGDSDEEKKKFEGGGFGNNDNWGVQNDNNEYRGWKMYDDNNCFYGDVKNENNEGSGGDMSRYKTTRFRKDGNRRKPGYSCSHVNPVGSHGHRWTVKKPVS